MGRSCQCCERLAIDLVPTQSHRLGNRIVVIPAIRTLNLDDLKPMPIQQLSGQISRGQVTREVESVMLLEHTLNPYARAK